MSERELRDWFSFAAERPLPDELADLHNALLCSIVANLARSADSPPFQVADFLVLTRRPPPELPDDVVEVSEGERFARSLRR